MITEAERDEIIAVRDGKKRHIGKRDRNNPKFPLKKFVLCSCCGKPLTVSSPRGRHGGYHPTYSCYTKGCPMRYKSIPKKVIEPQFMELLNTITPSQELIAYMHTVILNKQAEMLARIRSTQGADKEMVDRLNHEREQIYKLAEAGVYDAATVSKRIAINDAAIATAQNRLSYEDT